MRDYYRLSFSNTNNRLILIRKLMLIFAIIIDVIIFFQIINIIFSKNKIFYGIMIGLLIFSSFLIRFISTKLIFSYTYTLRNNILEITKNSTMKNKILMSASCNEIELKRVDGIISLKKNLQFYVATTLNSDLSYYFLIAKGKKFLVRLDDFMFTLINYYKEKT